MGQKEFVKIHWKRDKDGIATSTFHGLKKALEEIEPEREGGYDFVVIIDYGSTYHSTEYGAVKGAAGNADEAEVVDSVEHRVAEERRRDGEVIRTVLGRTTAIIEVRDGASRPEAKRAEEFKRWKRLQAVREKTGKLACGRWADEVSSLLKVPEDDELQDYDYIVVAPDEGDRALNGILTHRHSMEAATGDPDPGAPRKGQVDIRTAGELVARVPAANVIVIGRDSDEPAANTARERGWTILVKWTHGVPYRRRGEAAGASRTSWSAYDEFRDTIVLNGKGLDIIYGHSRDRRIKRMLLIGQDYSGHGLYGAGAKTVDSGRVDYLFRIDWRDKDALAGGIARYFGASRQPEAVLEVAGILSRAYKTLAGDLVETFDLGAYFAELDAGYIGQPRQPQLVWPGPASAPAPAPVSFSSHPMRPKSLAPKMPRAAERAGQFFPNRSPRVASRPIEEGTSVLGTSYGYGPDPPRKPKKTPSDTASTPAAQPVVDDEQVDQAATSDAATSAETAPQGDEGGVPVPATTQQEKPRGTFTDRARKMTYDFGPASTPRMKHKTWERALVPECFIEVESEPPTGRRARKRHLSGAEQSRKRRGLRPWRRRRRRQKSKRMAFQTDQDVTKDGSGGQAPMDVDDTAASDEDEDVEMVDVVDADSTSEDIVMVDVKAPRQSATAEPRHCRDDAAGPPGEEKLGRRRGYNRSGTAPPRQPAPEYRRIYPLSHTSQLFHFVAQQSLPWVAAAYNCWALSSTDGRPSRQLQEQAAAAITARSAQQDGIARLGAAIAQPQGGHENAQERAQLDVSGAHATSSGFPMPLNCTRERWTTMLRPFDTAVHGEVRSFREDLGAFGKAIGRDLLAGIASVNSNLFRQAPISASAATSTWLASAPAEIREILGDALSSIMKNEPFSLVRANRGRAAPAAAMSIPTKARLAFQQRPPLVTNQVATQIGTVFALPNPVRAGIEAIFQGLVEARDGLFGHAQLCKRAGSTLARKYDGYLVDELVSDAGLGKYMVAAQLLVRRLAGLRLLPELRLEAIALDAESFAASLDHYEQLCRDGRRLAEHAIASVRPRLADGCEKTRMTILEPILDLFELEEAPLSSSQPSSSLRQRLKDAITTTRRLSIRLVDGASGKRSALALVRPSVRLVVRRAESRAVRATRTRIGQILGQPPTRSLYTAVSKYGCVSEFLNTICRSDKWPRGFVPTGSISASASSWSLFGVKVSILRYNRRMYLESKGLDLSSMSSGAVFELGVRRRTDPYFPRWSNIDLDKCEPQFRRDLAIEYRQEGGVVAPFQIPTLVQYRNNYTPPSLPLAPRSRNPRTPAFRRLTRLKAPPRPYHAPSPTIDGLPKYWPNSDSPTGIARVRAFAGSTFRSSRIVAGVDIGEVIPIASFAATPDAKGRCVHEGVALYGRGSLAELQREASRTSSRLLEERRRCFVDGSGLQAGGGGAQQPEEVRRSVVERLERSGHSRRAQTEQARLASNAEATGAASELVRHILGGTLSQANARDPTVSVLAYVGKGSIVRTGGGTGPRSGAVIARKLETELRRLGVNSMLVRTNEIYTSSVCPNSACRSADGRRTTLLVPRRSDGSEILRLSYCPTENKMYHHDTVGCTNIAISGEVQRIHGLPACPIEGMASTMP